MRGQTRGSEFRVPFPVAREDAPLNYNPAKPRSAESYITIEEADAYVARVAGGPGSGNHGHEGRPGQVGGSSSKSDDYGASLDNLLRERAVKAEADFVPVTDREQWDQQIESMYSDSRELSLLIPWQGTLIATVKFKKTVDDYGRSGDGLNAALRGEIDVERPEMARRLMAEQMAVMDAYIAVAPKLEEDEVLFRGLGLTEEAAASIEVGTIITDPGYSSSTTSKKLAEDFMPGGEHGWRPGVPVLMQIEGGGGVAAALVGSAGHLARVNGGDEFIWPRNQRFEVVRVERSDNVTRVIVNVISA